MSATEAPVNSWFDIPYVAFSTAGASYAVCGAVDWTAAHVAVTEVGTEKFGLIVCELLKCGRAATPTTAKVGLVLDENVVMYTEPENMTLLLRVHKAPSLVTLVPLSAEYMLLKLRFNERTDYLTCVKVINEANIATEDERESMKLALRRALATAVPRHSSPCQELCEMHKGTCSAS
ncbi:hypothetical protein C8Q76DRAFT_690429 [Earliella scabrosa]|nr:hypothetical protein C8Q76DRAFT_690429 [Earliella scabrosa]